MSAHAAGLGLGAALLGPSACLDPSDPAVVALCSLAVLDGDDPLAYATAWSPVSDHALGGTEHELRLLAIEDDGRALRVADRLVGDYAHLSLAWTADGTRALSGGSDGAVRVLAVDLTAETLTPLASVPVGAEALYSVALSPDERHVLACGGDGQLSLLRFDAAAATLTEVDRFAAHQRCFEARWSPEGTHALSLGSAEHTFLYRVDTEAEDLEVIAVVRSGEVPGAAAFGRDRSELVLGTFGARHRVSYLHFDAISGELEPLQAFDDFVSGLKVIEPAPDASALVIAAHDGVPRLYLRTEPTDPPGLRLVASIDDDGAGSHAIGWSPDQRFLVRAASRRDRFEVLGTRGCPPG